MEGARGIAWQSGGWFSVMPLCFELEALDLLHLPPCQGSMSRGVPGHALRAAVCMMGRESCAECPFHKQCARAPTLETLPDRRTVLPGEALVPVWLLLWPGLWIHAGKIASMGPGRYELRSMESLPFA